MRPWSTRSAAEQLLDEGLSDAEVGRRLSLPRATVREWRLSRAAPSPRCPRCWERSRPIVIEPETYAELLGLYLGDGCISRLARTFSLRLALDARYETIVEDTRTLLAGVFPANRVTELRADRGSTAVLCIYSRHLPCVFPQHGPGKKHQRAIRLEAWQQALVDAASWELLRGLIRSDGALFVNRTGR